VKKDCFERRGCCIGKLFFFEEYHLSRALFAGNVAQVQDVIDGIGYIYIPLWTLAVLCSSN
jgi:hypothetical protein